MYGNTFSFFINCFLHPLHHRLLEWLRLSIKNVGRRVPSLTRMKRFVEITSPQSRIHMSKVINISAGIEQQQSWFVLHLCVWNPLKLSSFNSIRHFSPVCVHPHVVFSVLCMRCSGALLFLSNRTSLPIWPFQASSYTMLNSTRHHSWKTDAIRWVYHG